MSGATTVLILDHEPDTRSLLAQVAERLGWSVRPADSALSALALLEATECHIVIADLDAAGVDGLELIRRVRRDHPLVDVVAIASHEDSGKTDEAVRLGIPDFLVRPFGLVEARRVLGRLAEKRPPDGDAPKLSSHSEQVLRRLISSSSVMLKVKEAILKA